MNAPLLEVRGLVKIFRAGAHRRHDRGAVRAVDDVSFRVDEGHSVGIAGESGSGKTTLARLILCLESASSGSIMFAGAEIAPGSDLSTYRRQVQAVFQDSPSALSPRMRIRDIVAEPLVVQEPGTRQAEVDRRVDEQLERVGLSPAIRRAHPHELSGGQKQRVAIARALIVRPRMLILDEPVSALDVSIRSQVLNLLLDLQEEHGLSYLIIAHDLAVLRHVSRELIVIYHGRIVEQGPTEAVLFAAKHPYTRALIAATPRLDGVAERRAAVREAEGLEHPKEGCAFAPRCEQARAVCRVETPALTKISETSCMHHAACHAVHWATEGRQ